MENGKLTKQNCLHFKFHRKTRENVVGCFDEAPYLLPLRVSLTLEAETWIFWKDLNKLKKFQEKKKINQSNILMFLNVVVCKKINQFFLISYILGSIKRNI